MAELLILGASARSAAQSAKRAGFDVVTADLFADRDLEQIARRCFRVKEYPHELLAVRQQFPELPVMYTGAIENYPDLIAKLEGNLLWGNHSQSVRACRDLANLQNLFSRNGIRFPSTVQEKPCSTAREANDQQQAGQQQWLIKPNRSAAGHNVVDSLAEQTTAPPDHLFQEKIAGVPCSSCFVATPHEVHLIGTSRMLVGHAWGHPLPYGYCGSLAYQPSDEELLAWERLGQAVANEFKLRGVFGVDAIQTDSEIVPIEINPRFTASMECFESMLERSVVSLHVDAFTKEHVEPQKAQFRASAKLILFANQDIPIPAELPTRESVELVDLPQPDQTIPKGHPVLSIKMSTADESLLRETGRQILAAI